MKNIRIFVPVMLGLMVCFFILGCGSVTGGGGGGGGGGSTFTADIYVSTTGSDDAGDGSSANPYQTIQYAMDVVASNETIGVLAGTYTENLTWTTRECVTLKGISMATVTLDANHAGRAIDIEPGATLIKATIKDMTIANGHIHDHGGGIYLTNAANTTLFLYDVYIHNCSIESGNTQGGAIYVSGASATFEAIRCLIKNNTALASGGGSGGIYSGCLTCRISSCEISDNYTGGGSGGISMNESYGRIENSIIHNNIADGTWGGGLATFNADPGLLIVNCTITSNEANHATFGKGGGFAAYFAEDEIINCIIWGNTAVTTSNEVFVNAAIPADYITYSDVKGGFSGTGNINMDPRFTSATDFHLSGISPAVVFAGGTLEVAPSVDYDGNTRPNSNQDLGECSMGAYEYWRTTD